MKTFYTNLRKLTPIVVTAIILSMLASCSSSNQMASSFSKRKYMPGHFSDPIAKVKTEAVNTIASAANSTKKVVDEIKTIAKTEEKNVAQPVAVAQVKATPSKTNKPRVATKTLSQNHVAAKLAVAVDTKNTSMQETSATYSSPSSLENVQHDSGEHHHYFLYFLLSLLAMILFLILAAASVVGSSGSGFFLWIALYYIAGIAALVFLVMWIISLAS